ncbi:minor tail protein [Microbacterium phage Dewdrop]|nr:minor tail protein [Microbacterium phage Leaf]QGZ17445.1 minor tail protein [Microbacterium phage Dewdrop]
MTYEGYLAFGGNEVVNNERARGYAESADCPMFWLKGARCFGLAPAIGDSTYDYSNIINAPWYDSTVDEISRRFFGVFATEIEGVEDSTRTAKFTEGIDDGGVIGRARRATREVKVKALLLGRGQDAVEYGQSWLSSVLDPDACGQLSVDCGTAEMSVFSTCPPERREVEGYSEWVEQERNLLTGPSFEAAGSQLTLRTNLNANPSLESSVLYWATTVAAASLTATAQGAQVDVTAGPTSVPLIFQGSDLTVAPGEYLSSSMEVTVPLGFPALSLELRNYAYGAAVAVSTSGVVTIQPGETKRISADANVVAPAGTTGMRTILYGTAAPTGARLIVRRALAEKRIRTSSWFDGAQPGLLVQENLVTNPRAVATGGGWNSNDGSRYTITLGATPPVPHPLGITTAAEARALLGDTSVLASIYNFDGLLNTSMQQRIAGMWVLVTEPGYRMANVEWQTGEELPVNEWVFVRQVLPRSAGAYQTATISKISGTASLTVRAYMTGAVVLPGTEAPKAYFDGSTQLPGRQFGWRGTAGQSASYEIDIDLTTATTGSGSTTSQLLQGISAAIYSTPSNVAFGIRSSKWAKEGAYSLRQIPSYIARGSAYTELLNHVNSRGLERGKTYTLIGTFRQEAPQPFTIAQFAQRSMALVGTTAGSYDVNVQAQNVAGEQVVKLVFTLPPTGDFYLRMYNGGQFGTDPDTFWDLLTILEGTDDGENFAFSGSSPSSDLMQFRWLGAVDGSQSVYETRREILTPEDDETYNARVDLARRFMRGAGVISGPFKVSERESNGFWVYEVQFVLAGGPSILGVTKALALSPTLPSVVQDIPYNLLPYPSAELPDLTGATTTWVDAVGGAGTQITVPTHVSPPGGQTTHPSVLDFGPGGSFNGYRYWMAHTPYPAGNDAHEDPNIAVSNDGSTWLVPSGLVNPLDNQPGSPGAYNSDTELVVHPDGGLLLMWRTYNPATTGGEEQFWIRQSVDGITWTPKVLAYQSAASVRRVMSPTLIWESGGWTMYGVDILTSPNRVLRFRTTSSTINPAAWSAPVVVPVTVPAGRDPWHIQVRYIDGQYVGMLNDCVLDASGTAGDLYVITSADGLSFQRGATVAIPRAGGTGVGHTANYRASLVKKSVDELDVWFGGWVTSPSIIWNMFRTTLKAPRAVVGIPTATNYSLNPSVEVTVAGWGSQADGTNITTAMLTSGRVTNELAAVGTSSYRVVFTATGAGTNGYFSAQQEVDVSGRPTGSRVSINFWAAEVLMGGTPVRQPIEIIAYWRSGSAGTVLRTDNLGTVPVDGGAFSAKSIQPPAGATHVLVRAQARLTSWPAGTIVRLYADALAVTVP